MESDESRPISPGGSLGGAACRPYSDLLRMSREQLKRLDVKNILFFSFEGLLLILIAMLANLWVQSWLPAFREERARRKITAPLREQARRLDLTYEAVLSTAPADTLGKPAIWCLRNVGGDKALYNGEERRPVYVENSGEMSRSRGSTHETCESALVVIKKYTIDEFAGVRNFRLYVGFIEYL